MDEKEITDLTHMLSTHDKIDQGFQKAKSQDACFILIKGVPQGQKFFIHQDEMLVGRDKNANILLNDQSISRRHAKIEKKNNIIYITDLNSANGTFINQKKLRPDRVYALKKEDTIQIGNFILKYLPAGELESLYLSSLSDAANLDSLTKIYNRGYLMQALELAYRRPETESVYTAILFLDIDYFKKINDTFGHLAGDYILKELTQLVQSQHLLANDIFARYGGEEFIILLVNSSLTNAQEKAESIRLNIENHLFQFEQHTIPVTVSIGVAELSRETRSQDILKNADSALYKAKKNGRNQVITFKAT